MIMLWLTLGEAAIAGIIIMLLFIPLNYFTSKFIKSSQTSRMKVKDERTKLSNELLNGIKVVKLYAWEEKFEKKINELRLKEVRMLRNVCILSRIVDIANATSPFLVAVASFTCFIIISPDPKGLTPSVAFVSLTIFNQLRQPMRMVANLINTLMQARVSNIRLRRFMNENELKENTEVALGNAIVLKDATLNWSGSNDAPILKKLNITVKRGELIAIVGSVGSGKSSVLSAILNEMDLINGKVKSGGSIAYVPQQSWIFNNSVKENVLFGDTLCPDFYKKVVEACQLSIDFQKMRNGDETIVGENGITLSGGQKARISLARAVYQDKDIYLLDDPLSAIDAHVGWDLFEHVIGPNGILNRKTRVLVTHNLQYTRNVDRIYVIEDGRIVEHGKFDDLAVMDGLFKKLILEASTKENEYKKTESMSKIMTHPIRPQQEEVILVKEKPELETVKIGRVGTGIYMLYFRTMGLANTYGFFLFYILHFMTMGLRSLWLSDWSNANAQATTYKNITDSTINTEYRLIIYAIFGGLEIVLLSTALALLTIGSLQASYALHAPVIKALLRAPLAFYDKTPLGRIINRLSRDLDVVDKLQDSFRMLMQCLLNACMILALVSLSTPIFLVFVIPFIFVYYNIMKYFIPTSRQLKRLESAHRSPIMSMISESIHGTSSIRAFKKTESICKQLAKKVDKFSQCRYLNNMANRWLATRLELLGNATVFFASLSATVSTKYLGLTSGMAGLSVSYALTITEVLNICVRMISEIENNIVSVERIREYQCIESEAQWEEPTVRKTWPERGEIQFENYCMKYSGNQPHVLENINLNIIGGEKVGIVGRTGSGKRTLRFNLDPFEQFSDERLWSCLEMCQLKDFALEDSLKLDRAIAEGGKNMSVGERQLLCLCRAILRGGKIVILDEATSSVDTVTDSLIQNVIRAHFSNSTTISIAHRLDTIADSDKIIVLDNGTVAESGLPSQLLKNPNSLYSQLIYEKRKNINKC
ncbi:unnamed protein product [Caenorhabditis bovis]|uniref:Uncharacterized protein n=1 Tax=Caenorhabditis bovis TaxID=2654633 RepID=A0A8S1ETG8_9PELO|nr:unnamed protein product [Caenorhabditis bovis]